MFENVRKLGYVVNDRMMDVLERMELIPELTTDYY